MHCYFPWRFHVLFLCVCLCLFPPEKNACPIDVYFTIDTSETIALQEPPPGSLVESIKVPWLSANLWLINLDTKRPNLIVSLPLNDSQPCCVMCCVVVVVVGLHKAVCTAFRRWGIQRCCADQLEHRWTALLPRTEGVQSHRTQERFHCCEFK